jgi:hypothetical protein
MNFPIPKNAPDMVLYIWKIIDLPSIPMNDLLYALSFDLFLLPPEGAEGFINKAITSKYLVNDENSNLSLSQNLKKRLETWQNKRKATILSKILTAKKATLQTKDMNIDNGSGFNVLLKAFLDKGTINRAATVSNAALSINEVNPTNGTIKANIAGKKEDSYLIVVDVNKKLLIHNCHDFQERRAQNKKFCKHIVKLFLILKEQDEKTAVFFLNQIAENVNEWAFSD